MLVTNNSGFARAAFEYGREQEASREVSSVITDFSLANMAWLKAPLGAPSIPVTELLAFAYAALEPSTVLMDKYLKEVEKLEAQGEISARDHQVLRSSQLAHAELMNLTLGEEGALTEQTVSEDRWRGQRRKLERRRMRSIGWSRRSTRRHASCLPRRGKKRAGSKGACIGVADGGPEYGRGSRRLGLLDCLLVVLCLVVCTRALEIQLWEGSSQLDRGV